MSTTPAVVGAGRAAGRAARPSPAAAALAVAVVVAGCSDAPETSLTTTTATRAAAPAEGATSTPSEPSASAGSAGPAAPPAPALGEGTVVRFSGAATSVDVVMGPDTPTTRAFLAGLPMTLALEEFAGREKIGYPEGGLDVEGTPGSDPEDGDLIYFTPWGNIGFYYDADGIGYSDDTPHLGTYRASEDQLAQLEGEVVVAVVSP